MTSSDHDAGAGAPARVDPAPHLETGDPSRVPGLVVTDLDDVEQVTAIPPMPGLSFRGGAPAWWEQGGTYTEPGWLRTSRDPLVGTANFAGGRVVAVSGAGGRDVAAVSDHPEEQETVFLPGSRFTVLRQGDLDGVWVAVVQVHAENDPALDVDATVTRVATVLGRARTLPPVTVARPERFAGEFGTRR